MRFSLLMLALVITAGCSRPDADRFYSAEHGFSIKFPPGWTIEEGYKGSVVRVQNSEYSTDKSFQESINIVVDSLRSEMSIDEYYASARSVLKKSLPGLIEKQTGTLVVDEKPVYWFTYTYPLKPITVKVIVFCIDKKNSVFLITCIAEEERFDVMKNVFDESAGSFSFK